MAKRLPEGISLRHARSCPSRSGGRCRCAPRYQAQAWSPRDRKRLTRTFPTLAAARGLNYHRNNTFEIRDHFVSFIRRTASLVFRQSYRVRIGITLKLYQGFLFGFRFRVHRCVANNRFCFLACLGAFGSFI